MSDVRNNSPIITSLFNKSNNILIIFIYNLSVMLTILKLLERYLFSCNLSIYLKPGLSFEYSSPRAASHARFNDRLFYLRLTRLCLWASLYYYVARILFNSLTQTFSNWNLEFNTRFETLSKFFTYSHFSSILRLFRTGFYHKTYCSSSSILHTVMDTNVNMNMNMNMNRPLINNRLNPQNLAGKRTKFFNLRFYSNNSSEVEKKLHNRSSKPNSFQLRPIRGKAQTDKRKNLFVKLPARPIREKVKIKDSTPNRSRSKNYAEVPNANGESLVGSIGKNSSTYLRGWIKDWIKKLRYLQIIGNYRLEENDKILLSILKERKFNLNKKMSCVALPKKTTICNLNSPLPPRPGYDHSHFIKKSEPSKKDKGQAQALPTNFANSTPLTNRRIQEAYINYNDLFLLGRQYIEYKFNSSKSKTQTKTFTPKTNISTKTNFITEHADSINRSGPFPLIFWREVPNKEMLSADTANLTNKAKALPSSTAHGYAYGAVNSSTKLKTDYPVLALTSISPFLGFGVENETQMANLSLSNHDDSKLSDNTNYIKSKSKKNPVASLSIFRRIKGIPYFRPFNNFRYKEIAQSKNFKLTNDLSQTDTLYLNTINKTKLLGPENFLDKTIFHIADKVQTTLENDKLKYPTVAQHAPVFSDSKFILRKKETYGQQALNDGTTTTYFYDNLLKPLYALLICLTRPDEWGRGIALLNSNNAGKSLPENMSSQTFSLIAAKALLKIGIGGGLLIKGSALDKLRKLSLFLVSRQNVDLSLDLNPLLKAPEMSHLRSFILPSQINLSLLMPLISNKRKNVILSFLPYKDTNSLAGPYYSHLNLSKIQAKLLMISPLRHKIERVFLRILRVRRDLKELKEDKLKYRGLRDFLFRSLVKPKSFTLLPSPAHKLISTGPGVTVNEAFENNYDCRSVAPHGYAYGAVKSKFIVRKEDLHDSHSVEQGIGPITNKEATIYSRLGPVDVAWEGEIMFLKKLLNSFFKKMHCIISLPVLEYLPDKLNIRLFYYLKKNAKTYYSASNAINTNIRNLFRNSQSTNYSTNSNLFHYDKNLNPFGVTSKKSKSLFPLGLGVGEELTIGGLTSNDPDKKMLGSFSSSKNRRGPGLYVDPSQVVNLGAAALFSSNDNNPEIESSDQASLQKISRTSTNRVRLSPFGHKILKDRAINIIRLKKYWEIVINHNFVPNIRHEVLVQRFHPLRVAPGPLGAKDPKKPRAGLTYIMACQNTTSFSNTSFTVTPTARAPSVRGVGSLRLHLFSKWRGYNLLGDKSRPSLPQMKAESLLFSGKTPLLKGILESKLQIYPYSITPSLTVGGEYENVYQQGRGNNNIDSSIKPWQSIGPVKLNYLKKDLTKNGLYFQNSILKTILLRNIAKLNLVLYLGKWKELSPSIIKTKMNDPDNRGCASKDKASLVILKINGPLSKVRLIDKILDKKSLLKGAFLNTPVKYFKEDFRRPNLSPLGLWLQEKKNTQSVYWPLRDREINSSSYIDATDLNSTKINVRDVMPNAPLNDKLNLKPTVPGLLLGKPISSLVSSPAQPALLYRNLLRLIRKKKDSKKLAENIKIINYETLHNIDPIRILDLLELIDNIRENRQRITSTSRCTVRKTELSQDARFLFAYLLRRRDNSKRTAKMTLAKLLSYYNIYPLTVTPNPLRARAGGIIRFDSSLITNKLLPILLPYIRLSLFSPFGVGVTSKKYPSLTYPEESQFYVKDRGPVKRFLRPLNSAKGLMFLPPFSIYTREILNLETSALTSIEKNINDLSSLLSKPGALLLKLVLEQGETRGSFIKDLGINYNFFCFSPTVNGGTDLARLKQNSVSSLRAPIAFINVLNLVKNKLWGEHPKALSAYPTSPLSIKECKSNSATRPRPQGRGREKDLLLNYLFPSLLLSIKNTDVTLRNNNEGFDFFVPKGKRQLRLEEGLDLDLKLGSNQYSVDFTSDGMPLLDILYRRESDNKSLIKNLHLLSGSLSIIIDSPFQYDSAFKGYLPLTSDLKYLPHLTANGDSALEHKKMAKPCGAPFYLMDGSENREIDLRRHVKKRTSYDQYENGYGNIFAITINDVAREINNNILSYYANKSSEYSDLFVLLNLGHKINLNRFNLEFDKCMDISRKSLLKKIKQLIYKVQLIGRYLGAKKETSTSGLKHLSFRSATTSTLGLAGGLLSTFPNGFRTLPLRPENENETISKVLLTKKGKVKGKIILDNSTKLEDLKETNLDNNTSEIKDKHKDLTSGVIVNESIREKHLLPYPAKLNINLLPFACSQGRERGLQQQPLNTELSKDLVLGTKIDLNLALKPDRLPCPYGRYREDAEKADIKRETQNLELFYKRHIEEIKKLHQELYRTNDFLGALGSVGPYTIIKPLPFREINRRSKGIVAYNKNLFKKLLVFLKVILNKEIELDITRIKNPFNETHILNQILGELTKNNSTKFYRLSKKIIDNAILKRRLTTNSAWVNSDINSACLREGGSTQIDNKVAYQSSINSYKGPLSYDQTLIPDRSLYISLSDKVILNVPSSRDKLINRPWSTVLTQTKTTNHTGPADNASSHRGLPERALSNFPLSENMTVRQLAFSHIGHFRSLDKWSNLSSLNKERKINKFLAYVKTKKGVLDPHTLPYSLFIRQKDKDHSDQIPLVGESNNDRRREKYKVNLSEKNNMTVTHTHQEKTTVAPQYMNMKPIENKCMTSVIKNKVPKNNFTLNKSITALRSNKNLLWEARDISRHVLNLDNQTGALSLKTNRRCALGDNIQTDFLGPYGPDGRLSLVEKYTKLDITPAYSTHSLLKNEGGNTGYGNFFAPNLAYADNPTKLSLPLSLSSRVKGGLSIDHSVDSSNLIEPNTNKSGRKLSLVESSLSGIKLKLSGRLERTTIIPRRTNQELLIGNMSRGSTSFKNDSRLTYKNKRGAYSITVSTSQIMNFNPGHETVVAYREPSTERDRERQSLMSHPPTVKNKNIRQSFIGQGRGLANSRMPMILVRNNNNILSRINRKLRDKYPTAHPPLIYKSAACKKN